MGTDEQERRARELGYESYTAQQLAGAIRKANMMSRVYGGRHHKKTLWYTIRRWVERNLG